MNKRPPIRPPAVMAYTSRDELIAAREKARKAQVKRTSLDNLHQVFLKMGGIQGMFRWAEKNPTEFYKLWSKILPKEIITTVGTPQDSVRTTITIEAEPDSEEANALRPTPTTKPVVRKPAKTKEQLIYEEFIGGDVPQEFEAMEDAPQQYAPKPRVQLDVEALSDKTLEAIINAAVTDED